MRSLQYRDLARQVQDQAVALLLRLLQPPDYSPRCTAGALLSALVLAAARRLSLAAVACLRPGSPSRETLRQALAATLPDYAALLRRAPALLAAALPRALRKRAAAGQRFPLAIDLHAVPYYKRAAAPPGRVRKGQRRGGTCYAHQYATCALVCKGRSYTVGLTAYAPGEPLADVVRRLLRQAAARGVRPRHLLLDRAFWSAAVFAYLRRARCPFLIPVAARGKGPKAAGGPTGTQALLHGRKSGWYRYRLAGAGGQAVWLTIAVQRRRKGDRRGRPSYAYAVGGLSPGRLEVVRQRYRRRFRIEASYRLLEAARARTSSRDEGVRLLYVLLAAVLANLWLQLRAAAPRRGSERYFWERLLAAYLGLLLFEPAAPEPPRRE